VTRLSVILILLTFGCGLDELIAGYTGAGGSGGLGGAGGQSQGGQGGTCAIDNVLSVERAKFTTQSTEPEEIAALDVPAGVAPDGWVLLLSARLSSESTQAESQEVRYLVDGVERGIGQSRSDAMGAGDGGPWQHFDLLPPDSQRVSIEFRSLRAAFLATISDLHVVAFAVPPGADPVFAEDDMQIVVQPNTTQRIYQTVASVDIPAGAPGDYLVMLALVGNEVPGIASIGVRAFGPDAAHWPVESMLGMAPRPYLSNPLDEWNSFMLVRSVQSDGSAIRVDLQVDGSGIEGSTVRDIRALALRQDAFAQAKLATALDEQILMPPARDTMVGELDISTDPCHGVVVAQFVTLWAEGLRSVRFGSATFDHHYDSDEAKLTYATLGVLPSGGGTLTTTVSAPTTALSVRESVIVALELP